ncbi:MAG: chemotaxis protein CheB [Oscillospiraceae bacterium]|nr:chemotaxis protein CheB [Oscillospiraceae bacterium]
MAIEYSIIAVVEETPLFSEVCSLISKEPNHNLKKMSLDRVTPAMDAELPSIVLIFEEKPSQITRKWIKKAIDNYKVPVILITREDIAAQDLGVSDKMIRTCQITSTDLGAATGIARNINIRIKLSARKPGAASSLEGVKRAAEMAAAAVAEKVSDSGNKGGNAETASTPAFWDGKRIIAVGASMGGVETVTAILKKLPANMPPVVVTQHMPEGFTEMYAKSLNLSCAMKVVHAEDKMPIEAGTVYIAPGGLQMKVKKVERGYIIVLDDTEKVDGHKPSVTVLFRSVAQACGKNALGVILTGMGSDGARGLLEMRRAGAQTLGQDEASAVVYGMPKVAFDMGAVMEQVSMEQVHTKMIAYANK